MFFKHWPVLLVDDEPDVLSVSKLAMKNITVYGLPLKIYTAESKAGAIALFKDNAEVGCSLAVAMLDVVMETDSAGLELCDYIRHTMENRLTQIYVRTGQPGLAPERQVIDRYDINGYYTKVEATEDKLYSMIKSGVREYLAFGMADATLDLITQLIAANGSRRRLSYVLSAVCGDVPDQAETPRWISVDGQTLFPSEDPGFDVTMQNLAKYLAKSEAFILNPEGDSYFSDHNEGIHLLKVPGGANKAEVCFLFKSRFAPPAPVVGMMHGFTRALAMLWKQSAEDR
ncbi:MAG: response regulator [Gammaproteobacteria bacterium]